MDVRFQQPLRQSIRLEESHLHACAKSTKRCPLKHTRIGLLHNRYLIVIPRLFSAMVSLIAFNHLFFAFAGCFFTTRKFPDHLSESFSFAFVLLFSPIWIFGYSDIHCFPSIFQQIRVCVSLSPLLNQFITSLSLISRITYMQPLLERGITML